MRIKSQPQKQSEEYQETIDILSIAQSSSPESNESDNCLEPLYEVESIIMKQINKDESQYLVKWKGYSELTWEPLSSLQNCQLLLEEFDQQQSSKNVIITTKSVSKKTITKSQKSKKKSKKSKKQRPFENEDQIQSFQNLGRTIKINGITNQQLKVQSYFYFFRLISKNQKMINLNHPGSISQNYIKLLLKSSFNSMNHYLLSKLCLNRQLRHPIQVCSKLIFTNYTQQQ